MFFVLLFLSAVIAQPCGNNTVCCVQYGTGVASAVGLGVSTINLPYFVCIGNMSVTYPVVKVPPAFWGGLPPVYMTVLPSTYPNYLVYRFYYNVRGYANMWTNNGGSVAASYTLSVYGTNWTRVITSFYGLMCAWTKPPPDTTSLLAFIDNVDNQAQPNSIIPIAYDNALPALVNFTTVVKFLGDNHYNFTLYNPSVVFLSWTTTNTTDFNMNSLVWHRNTPPFLSWMQLNVSTSPRGLTVLQFSFTPRVVSSVPEYLMLEIQLRDSFNYYDPEYLVVTPVNVLPPPTQPNSSSSSMSWVLPVVLCIIAAVVCVGVAVWCYRRRKLGRESEYLLDTSSTTHAARHSRHTDEEQEGR